MRAARSPGRPSLTRRELLALGAASSLCPLLAGMLAAPAAHAEPAPAGPAAAPRLKRFIGIYAPHGIARELWLPRPGFDLAYEDCSLQPFDDATTYGQSFKDRILVIDGLDLAAGIEAGTVGHEGARVMLTGSAADGRNASIDQHLAVEAGLGASTPFSSLTLGVGVHQTDIGSNVSYLKGGRPVPKLIDPSLVFDTVFGRAILPDDPTAREQLRRARALEQSSLDFLTEQLAALRGRLPAAETAKLDEHLTAQRELERRLAHFEGSCALPERPKPFPSVRAGAGAARYFDAITDLQIDLLAAAMACDSTRFATLFLNDLSRTRLLPDMPEDIHFEVSHLYRGAGDGEPGRPETWRPLARQNRYAYGKVARLMQRLSERGLLDDTLIFVSSDMGDPSRHSSRSVPALLCGGGFPGGRQLVVQGGAAARANNHLLVSICRWFGLNVERFGEARDPEIIHGPLAGLA